MMDFDRAMNVRVNGKEVNRVAFNGVTIWEKYTPASILLESDKSYASEGDTINLTATVYDKFGRGCPDKNVEFINNDTSELIATATTNNNGVATVSYLVQNTGPLYIKAKCGIILSEVYGLFINLYQNNILTCPRVKIGGSSGTTTISELSDGDIYIKRNGWSMETLFQLLTLNKPFRMLIDVYNYNGDHREYLIITDNAGNRYRFNGINKQFNLLDDTYVNISSTLPLNSYYTMELEYTGESLIGRVYDENASYYENTHEFSLNDTFTIGIGFGYLGTSDNRGYENKIKNIRIY